MNRLLASCLKTGFCFWAALAVSCSEMETQEDDGRKQDLPSASFAVDEFAPLKGLADTEVVFHGHGFGSSADDVKVYFNDMSAEVTEVSEAIIKVRVPKLPGDECRVKVCINDEEVVCDKTFDYLIQMYVRTVAGGSLTESNPVGETPLEEVEGFCNMMDSGLAVDSDGNVYFCVRGTDPSATDLYMIDSAKSSLVHIANCQTGENGSLVFAVSLSGELLYVMKTDASSLEYAVYDRSAEEESAKWSGFSDERLLAYEGERPSGGANARNAMTVHPVTGKLYTVTSGVLEEIDPESLTMTSLGTPVADYTETVYGLCFDPKDNDRLYISAEGKGVVYSYDTDTGDCLRFAGSGYGNLGNYFGDGDLGGSAFDHPRQIIIDNNYNMYIADQWHGAIRKISISGETINTFAGNIESGYVDGLLDDARFDDPVGIAVDGEGSIYVSDRDNYAIRKIALE